MTAVPKSLPSTLGPGILPMAGRSRGVPDERAAYSVKRHAIVVALAHAMRPGIL